MNICLYYGSDLDGQCSGAIYALAHQGEEYVLTPIDYGDPVNWDHLKDSDVTLIDFSLQPWSDFERLLKCARSVTWIDHHRSAIEEYHKAEDGRDWCPITTVLNETKAACELAWDYYFPTKNMTEKIGDKGQRYEIWCDDEYGTPLRIGWSDNPEAFKKAVELHPSWTNHRAINGRIVEELTQMPPKS